MPGTGKSRDKYLRLELDNNDLYEAWQNIKAYHGIRSNTDALRKLILDENRRISVNKLDIEEAKKRETQYRKQLDDAGVPKIN